MQNLLWVLDIQLWFPKGLHKTLDFQALQPLALSNNSAKNRLQTATTIMAFKWSKPLYLFVAVLLLPSLVSNYLLYSKQILNFIATNFPRPDSNVSTLHSLKPHNTDWFSSMTREYDAACPEQNFRPYIFTFDPLIIYLEHYLSYAETRYLIQLA